MAVHEDAAALDCDSPLTSAEAACLRGLGLEGSRRREWIRGRKAARRLLTLALGGPAPDLVTAPDGAPRAVGSNADVSISHDGDVLAVAVTTAPHARVAVDVCLLSREAQAGALLSRLRVGGDLETVGSVAAFAAIESAIKLGRLGIGRLLAGGVLIARHDETRVVVTGLGPDVIARVWTCARYAVALATRQVPP